MRSLEYELTEEDIVVNGSRDEDGKVDKAGSCGQEEDGTFGIGNTCAAGGNLGDGGAGVDPSRSNFESLSGLDRVAQWDDEGDDGRTIEITEPGSGDKIKYGVVRDGDTFNLYSADLLGHQDIASFDTLHAALNFLEEMEPEVAQEAARRAEKAKALPEDEEDEAIEFPVRPRPTIFGPGKTVLAILEKVGKGNLSASAAISLIKSMGVLSEEVRSAILSQDVIGRERRRKGRKTIDLEAIRGSTQEEEEDYILNPVRNTLRRRLIDMLDLDGDGLVTNDDFQRFVLEWGNAVGSVEGDENWDPDLDLNGDGVIDGADFDLYLNGVVEYGGFDEIVEEEKEKEEDDDGDEGDEGDDGPHEGLDPNGNGTIRQNEWDQWMEWWREGDIRADINGDGVVDAADQKEARRQGAEYGHSSLDMGEWEGPLPMIDPKLNKLVSILYYGAMDQETELTPQQAIEVAGRTAKVIPVGNNLVGTLRAAFESAGIRDLETSKPSRPTSWSTGGGGVGGGQPGAGG